VEEGLELAGWYLCFAPGRENYQGYKRLLDEERKNVAHRSMQWNNLNSRLDAA